MNKYLGAGLVTAAVGAVGSLIGMGYQYAYRKGKKTGAKEKEDEILNDCVYYVALNRIEEFANDIMEMEGVNEDYPLLIIRSDKYDYLHDTDPKRKPE